MPIVAYRVHPDVELHHAYNDVMCVDAVTESEGDEDLTQDLEYQTMLDSAIGSQEAARTRSWRRVV
eukprot:12713082-Prorocentrum_lima.AAC.1